MKKLIIGVENESIAEELGITAGSRLVTVNGKDIVDIFDYRYYLNDEFCEIEIEGPDGEITIYEVEKDFHEDLGILFKDGLMDEEKSCRNKCVFCFIDQLPKGMRKTLYFKDDDMRLSFLSGNYVTMTNMSDKDIDRIIFYHLSPINISVHTTDPELRKKMLGNRFAGKAFRMIDRLCEAGIDMNFQVVLCKGLNDGVKLEETIRDLSRYIGKGKSLSIVPVGLSDYRNGLYSLEPLNSKDCAETIALVESFQKIFYARYGTRFVYCADEFYLKADMDLPEFDVYEDFYQIENGVGMMASFRSEFMRSLDKLPESLPDRIVSVITGAASCHFITELCNILKQNIKGLEVNVLKIENAFFGKNITVSGLLTGRDIIEQINTYTRKGIRLGDALLIPENAFKHGEDIFIDDMPLDVLCRRAGVKARKIKVDGGIFVKSICED